MVLEARSLQSPWSLDQGVPPFFLVLWFGEETVKSARPSVSGGDGTQAEGERLFGRRARTRTRTRTGSQSRLRLRSRSRSGSGSGSKSRSNLDNRHHRYCSCSLALFCHSIFPFNPGRRPVRYGSCPFHKLLFISRPPSSSHITHVQRQRLKQRHTHTHTEGTRHPRRNPAQDAAHTHTTHHTTDSIDTYFCSCFCLHPSPSVLVYLQLLRAVHATLAKKVACSRLNC